MNSRSFSVIAASIIGVSTLILSLSYVFSWHGQFAFYLERKSLLNATTAYQVKHEELHLDDRQAQRRFMISRAFTILVDSTENGALYTNKSIEGEESTLIKETFYNRETGIQLAAPVVLDALLYDDLDGLVYRYRELKFELEEMP